MVREHIIGYFNKIKNILDDLPIDKIEKISEIILNAYRNDKQVFIMGNGGSAATASHFACDLGKGTTQGPIFRDKKRFKVISLNDNTSLVTALSNDCGYDSVFMEQLVNLVNKGDVVIALTASGNSQNILNAVKYAKEKGAITIAFTGFEGGKIKDIVDEHLITNSKEYGPVEDSHLILEHLICDYLRTRLKNES